MEGDSVLSLYYVKLKRLRAQPHIFIKCKFAKTHVCVFFLWPKPKPLIVFINELQIINHVETIFSYEKEICVYRLCILYVVKPLKLYYACGYLIISHSH